MPLASGLGLAFDPEQHDRRANEKLKPAYSTMMGFVGRLCGTLSDDFFTTLHVEIGGAAKVWNLQIISRPSRSHVRDPPELGDAD